MNIDKNPVPFYELEGDVWTNFKPFWQKNNANCKSYQYKNNLFPDTYYFQHKVSASITKISEITAVELRNTVNNSVVPNDFQKHLYSDENGDKYLIIIGNLASNLIGGHYYISTTTAYNKYYSEIFCITNIIKNRIGLVWSTDNRVGNMIYKQDFKHKITIDAKLVPLPHEIEEQTEEDGFGNETPTYQKLTQPYFFSAVLPNYLAQALSALSLHNQFNLIDYFIGESGTESFDENITNVTVNVTPEEDACFSFVECTFVKQTIIKTACDNGLGLIEDEIIPLNQAPYAKLNWWGLSETQEDRFCNIFDSCLVKIIRELYDLDGNLDTAFFQFKKDDGIWTDISSALNPSDRISFTPIETGVYKFRVIAKDTQGIIGYSNELTYTMYDTRQQPVIEDLGVFDNTCGDSLDQERGKLRYFNINGTPNQIVKLQSEILQNVSFEFIFSILNRNMNDVLHVFNGGSTNSAVGRTDDFSITLNENGIGEFAIQLCLSPDPNEFRGALVEIQLTAFENDNTTLSDQTVSVIGRMRR